MGIDPGPHQVRGLLDGLGETDILHGNADQFSACLVVLNHSKPQAEGIERARGDCLASDRVHVR